MKETDIYRKVIIKTEKDLPKKSGRYETLCKGELKYLDYEFIEDDIPTEDKDWWMDYVEWWNKPIEPESEGQSIVKHPIDMNGNLNTKVSYCYHCGTNVKNQKYCHGCGRKLIWRTEQITDQPKETADQPVVKKNLTTETGRANYTDFGKQTQDALPQETYTDFYDIQKSTERHLGTVPADQSSANYMHVTPATFDDYMKMDKGEIINMLLECHRIMDIQRGLTGEAVNDVPTFTTTSATADHINKLTIKSSKMKKVSEVIKALQEMKDAYGDLPVTISIDCNQSALKEGDEKVVTSEVLFFGYDQFADKSDEINIRSFPY